MKRVFRWLLKFAFWSIIAVIGLATLEGLSLLWNYSLGTPTPDLEQLRASDLGVQDSRYKEQIEASRQALLEGNDRFCATALSICVGLRGEIVWSEAFGYIDTKASRQATTQTLFHTGSLIKPMTATAAVQLHERRQLSLSDDVRKHVPAFPEKKWPVTMRQLITHRSGIRHYNLALRSKPPFLGIETFPNQQFETTEQKLALFADDPLLFEPGTQYKYSSFGYTLLGEVVAAAGQKAFVDLLKESILDPLGMADTQPDRYWHPAENRVIDYDRTIVGRRIIEAERENCDYKWAAGGYLSTPTDLTKFGMALLDYKLVSNSTLEVLHAPVAEKAGTDASHFSELGLKSYYSREAQATIVYHGGSPTGGQSCLVIIPDSQVVVVIMSNTYTGGSWGLRKLATSIASDFQKQSRMQLLDQAYETK